MALSRSAAHSIAETSRGENVWSLLCRAALRGVEWAAAACSAQDAEARVERAELLIGYGFAFRPQAHHRVDWARLTEADRGAVAAALGQPRAPLPRPTRQ
jgi:hypothetical protein